MFSFERGHCHILRNVCEQCVHINFFVSMGGLFFFLFYIKQFKCMVHVKNILFGGRYSTSLDNCRTKIMQNTGLGTNVRAPTQYYNMLASISSDDKWL